MFTEKHMMKLIQLVCPYKFLILLSNGKMPMRNSGIFKSCWGGGRTINYLQVYFLAGPCTEYGH